jgi:hypothetical protein
LAVNSKRGFKNYIFHGHLRILRIHHLSSELFIPETLAFAHNIFDVDLRGDVDDLEPL